MLVQSADARLEASARVCKRTPRRRSRDACFSAAQDQEMRLKKLDCERNSCSHLTGENRLSCQYKCISEPCYAEIYGHDEVCSSLASRSVPAPLAVPPCTHSLPAYTVPSPKHHPPLPNPSCSHHTRAPCLFCLCLVSSKRARWTQSVGGFSAFAFAVFTGRKWRKGRSACARRPLNSELGCLEACAVESN